MSELVGGVPVVGPGATASGGASDISAKGYGDGGIEARSNSYIPSGIYEDVAVAEARGKGYVSSGDSV